MQDEDGPKAELAEREKVDAEVEQAARPKKRAVEQQDQRDRNPRVAGAASSPAHEPECCAFQYQQGEQMDAEHARAWRPDKECKRRALQRKDRAIGAPPLD